MAESPHSSSDVDKWVLKTAAVERTIRGLADGTYDGIDSIPSLREYGILS
eukprot:CAMPEP_0113526988 /NCGR_PEP_ID=MMETSP0015_2-20120614/1049_1 /TAXON_ID=2838 /ORGANISM="Odontella" /LENGTH=49 /DNA_ID=CAMNT_0000425379 /DNA_START=895 /DNA_END=1041 /DNA_ORIENTATION=+ /assembly_acc=CAM_ASM_000160